MRIKSHTGVFLAVIAATLVTVPARAAEHTPNSVPLAEFQSVVRTVERLAVRVDALEKQNQTLDAELADFRASDRALADVDANLTRQIAEIAVPDIAPLQAAVLALESNQEKHGGSIAALVEKLNRRSTAIEDLRVRAQSNAAAHAALEKRVSALKIPDLAPVNADILALKSAGDTQATAITGLKSAQSGLATSIAEMQSVDQTLRDQNATLSERLSAVRPADLTPVRQQVAELKAFHAELSARITELQSADQTLRNQNASLAERLSAIQPADLAPLRADIAELKATSEARQKIIDTLVSKEEALMTAATGLQAQIDSLEIPGLDPVEAAIAELDSRQTAHESALTLLKDETSRQGATITELKERGNALMVAATGLQSQIDDLDVPDISVVTSEIAKLEIQTADLREEQEDLVDEMDSLGRLDLRQLAVDVGDLKRIFRGVSREGEVLRFDSMNVQITSGAGATDAEVNGRGNLIIGYDEDIKPFLDQEKPGSDKSGSHNLVVGRGHNYRSYGGIVSGLDNDLAGSYSIAAGTRNQALGSFSAVTGGQLNTASGWYSSVSGGFGNIASENSASVSGGQRNEAAGATASVSGGFGVRAPGNSNWAAGRLFQNQ